MTRASRRRRLLLVCAVLWVAAACSAERDADPQSESSSAKQPRGENRAHDGDASTDRDAGTSDPDGRIAFGRITREDPLYGQVVALFSIDPDGSDEMRLTDGESAFPSWSPDGSRLAYTLGLNDGSWQIATMAADGSDVQVLTSGPGIHEVPTWSPDGRWLAYDYSPLLPSDPEFHTTLWRIDADGTNPRLLGDPHGFDVEPRISPDGTSIVFQRLNDDGETGTLMVRKLSTGKESALRGAGSTARHPAWSPDGESIVYNLARTPARRDQVERIPADGHGEPAVLFRGTDSRAGFKPVYSPDGAQILFGCLGVQGGLDDDACIMNADGSGVRIFVAEPGANENHFSWGPPTA